MKNKRILTVIILAVLICSTASAFAATRTVGTCQSSFKATSSTNAKASIQALSNGDTPFITSKITLQSAASGSSSFTDVSGVSPETLTIKNSSEILHSCYFKITSSKEYRIKIELTDQVGAGEVTTTYFCDLTR